MTPAAAAPATPAADAKFSEPPLPPVDTLTFESDFSPYLQPKVAEDVKRAALKTLFSDPRFNVMDGLDTYIDDYTLPDPMPAGMLAKLGKVYEMLDKTDGPATVVAASDAPGPGTPTPNEVADESDAREPRGEEVHRDALHGDGRNGDARTVEPAAVTAREGGKEYAAPGLAAEEASVLEDSADLRDVPSAERSSR
jgi:hypothetical protein